MDFYLKTLFFAKKIGDKPSNLLKKKPNPFLSLGEIVS